jgi:hypothetical protein
MNDYTWQRMAKNSESSSPPSWAQTLMQQIAQSHAMYESATIAQNERNTAQEERINRLETLLQNISIPNETPLTPSQTRTEPTVEVTKDRTRIVIQRPRPWLPDPAMFAGSSLEWPSWRTVMENKLAVDGEAIGSPQDQFAYVFSWLEKMALKNTNSFVKTQQNDREPQYGDVHQKSCPR